jgi:hypothetical protein
LTISARAGLTGLAGGVIYTADSTHASQNAAIDGAEPFVEALIEALVGEWVLLHMEY